MRTEAAGRAKHQLDEVSTVSIDVDGMLTRADMVTLLQQVCVCVFVRVWLLPLINRPSIFTYIHKSFTHTGRVSARRRK
jgi:hypothetical protein